MAQDEDGAGVLERAQHLALKAMWKQLPEEGLSEAEIAACSESDLLRFLRTRALDFRKAAAGFADYRRWRVNFAVDRLMLDDIRPELEKGLLSLRQRRDRQGLPILLFSMRFCSPGALNLPRFSATLVYLLERALGRREGAAGDAGGAAATVGMLLDYSNTALAQCDARVVRLLADLAHRRYPEQVAYVLVAAAPPFFPQLWATLVPHIEPWLLSKVHVLPAVGGLERLVEVMELACVPAALGGRAAPNHAQQMAEWAAQEAAAAPLAESEPTLSPERREAAAASVGTLRDAPVGKTGWMVKQGGRVKTWKRRFFVLTHDGQLRYYKSPTAVEPVGSIILTLQCRAGVDRANDHRPHTLALETPTRTWRFTCTDDAQMGSWVSVLNQTIVKVGAENGPPRIPPDRPPSARSTWVRRSLP